MMMLKRSFTNLLGLNKKTCLLILVLLSIGVDKSYSKYMPFMFFEGIPFVTCLLAFIFPFVLIKDELLTKSNLLLLAIIAYGTLNAVFRYKSTYEALGMTYMPILRQGASLSLGLVSYIVFRRLMRKFNATEVSQLVIISSIPFLLIGFYQFCTNHMVGYYPRVPALFEEPSYFGDYLVLLIAPCLVFVVSDIKGRKTKAVFALYAILWVVNLIGTQSGTAILKLITFMSLMFIFVDIQLKKKINISLAILTFIVIGLYLKRSYVLAIGEYALDVYNDPQKFFLYHTFYDRFYPIYITISRLSSFDGLTGLGFGGDYFEFANLFPTSTHKEMMLQKPTFSYFNSSAAKIILYLGIFGVAIIVHVLRTAFENKNQKIKVALLSVLIASLWGVANFSLPYIWLWLAIFNNEKSVTS